ncbi:MAG: hypothetical protein JNL11_05330 [Bdellovibrionaceae bacterium]|nr:hypothetical protein [Pseudobdellovibrionaceae bacterium]
MTSNQKKMLSAYRERKFSGLEDVTLMGRVLRGTHSSHFRTLTDDTTRNAVFVFDKEGLMKIAGKDGNQVLDSLGYEADYVRDLKASGTKFKLFLGTQSKELLPATYENLEATIAQTYANHPNLSTLLYLTQKYQYDLSANSGRDGIKRIEAAAPASFSQLYKLKPGHSLYMTASSMTISSTLWQFRAFLYNELRITEMHTNNGKTLNSDNTPGIPEFFAPDAPVDSFSDAILIDL